MLLSALRDGRWTVSWPGSGQASLERQFARRFAEYLGASHTIAVDHGSGALVLALELLDVGPGDEVIVPAMTWVATASAVLRVGALPVLADVDPDSGCISPDAVAALISPRTRAVICVHLACTVADLDDLLAIASGAGVHVIEDVAQAHGGRWRGRRLGTWGTIGAFSFQSGKVLAAGEGGALVVGSEDEWSRGLQLRADARTYAEPLPGAMELVERGDVIGANRTMSELHAAILLDRLPHLDAENMHRDAQAALLSRVLAEQAPWVRVVRPASPYAQRSIYELALRVDRRVLDRTSLERMSCALTAELQRSVYITDAPLFDSLLFRPHTLGRYRAAWTQEGLARSFGRQFPGTVAYAASTLLIHHSALLGDERDVKDLVDALLKVGRAIDDGQLAR
ncbi:MAG: DegT/DnrJ/EryC1/StrS family aminotransferase [Streptosporangiaceae bacterium]